MDAGVRSTVKFRTVSIALTLGIVACRRVVFRRSEGRGNRPAAYSLLRTRASSPSSSEDKTVGHEEFEIAPSGGGWVAKGTAENQATRGQFKQSLRFIDDAGRWRAPSATSGAPRRKKTNGAHILFANGVASITLADAGARRPFQQDLSFNTPLIAVLGQQPLPSIRRPRAHL